MSDYLKCNTCSYLNRAGVTTYHHKDDRCPRAESVILPLKPIPTEMWEEWERMLGTPKTKGG